MLTYITCTLFCFRRGVEMNSIQPGNPAAMGAGVGEILF